MKGSKNKFPRNCEKESKTEGDRIKVFTSKRKVQNVGIIFKSEKHFFYVGV